MFTSTSVKRIFDQSEVLSTAIITIKKDYNYYLDLSNWQLNTEVDEDAYVEAFPFLSDRIKFIQDLKNFYEARKTVFSHIERIFSKSFDDIQEWRTTILQGPKSGAKIALDKLERYEKKLNLEKYGIPIKETKNAIETQLQIPISKRINPNKDYFDYYNVPTGKKERDEIYDECAICKMKEETGITIQELFYVGTNERFKVFLDGKKCLCRCTIYYTYIDEQILIRTKPNKHDD
ncbi:15174_t:CDS:2 [Dentiscutata erythropus]|uniref:15174_t:CDS:1 n=1 Tax=Dentiscutata erythropus TaxID=1348616 RepID=A0A9N9P7V3_9GLOM|nr:15174_t:CDS:2 [Dentiscutata erythropus]